MQVLHLAFYVVLHKENRMDSGLYGVHLFPQNIVFLHLFFG